LQQSRRRDSAQHSNTCTGEVMKSNNENGWMNRQNDTPAYPKESQESAERGGATSSSHVNHGDTTFINAHPVDDAGPDSGTGHFEFDGAKDTHHRFVPNQSIATPGRMKGYGTEPGDLSRYQEHSQHATLPLPRISRQNDQLGERRRNENPAVTGGSHTTSDAPSVGIPGGGREQAEREKERIFGYTEGEGGRIDPRNVRRPNPNDARNFPHQGVSDRNFSDPANVSAPNKRKK
jgi:hypothetical protein